MSLWTSMKRLFSSVPEPGPKEGVYKFDGRGDLSHHRFHLRVDGQGKGVLIVDASRLIFLNGTALDYAKAALEDETPERMARHMRRRYKGLDKATAVKHYQDVINQLREYIHGNQEVIQTIGSDKMTIGADEMRAPYRMDLALTYRCANDCGHCYNPPGEKRELSVDQWESVLGKLWSLGIPHVVFTGGEPTEYEGLDKLVKKSEELGQITGLVSNGRNLARPGYLKELVRTGLDHVQITVLSNQEEQHDALVGCQGAWKETIEGLKTALSEDMYVSTNTTIMKSNLGEIEDTMRYLAGLGVKNIAFNSIIRSGKGEDAVGIDYNQLRDLMLRLRQVARETDTNLIWYSPTPYCEFNPVNLGLGLKQCTACAINMAIEPDGTVLPCQSYYEPLGNILTDPWDKIWDNELCVNIRGRKYLEGKCEDCKIANVCGGGCPLSRKHGDYVCLDRHSSM